MSSPTGRACQQKKQRSRTRHMSHLPRSVDRQQHISRRVLDVESQRVVRLEADTRTPVRLLDRFEQRLGAVIVAREDRVFVLLFAAPPRQGLHLGNFLLDFDILGLLQDLLDGHQARSSGAGAKHGADHNVLELVHLDLRHGGK